MKLLVIFLFSFWIFCTNAWAATHHSASEKTVGDFDYITATGAQNVPNLKITLFANGSFYNPYYFNNSPYFPETDFGKLLKWNTVNLLIGVPKGPWTPTYFDRSQNRQIFLGATVSESIARNPWSFLKTGDIPDWGIVQNDLDKYLNLSYRVASLDNQSQYKDFYLMATSTDRKTWPTNIYGFKYWPGVWAKDAESGNPIKGKFISDKDIFFVMTDKSYADHMLPGVQPGYSLNLQIEGSCYAFRDGYAENIVFFDLIVINKSQWNYKNLYIGVFSDPDIYTSFMFNFYRYEWPNYILSEQDEKTGKRINYNLSYVSDRGFFGKLDSQYKNSLACAGIVFLNTPPAGGVSNDHGGNSDKTAGAQLGITRWHNFLYYDKFYRSVLMDSTRERFEYAVLSGDTTGIDSVYKNMFFHPDISGHLDPHFDSPDGIFRKNPEGTDGMPLSSTGPIDLASGDTVHFAFAMVMGIDLKSLKQITRIAHRMYDLGYQRSGPPVPPQVTAVPGMGKVTLYWNNISETTPDAITGYHDFEGYKIYRTTINPAKNEWGKPWYDSMGRFLGFMPIAQFDKKDGIAGLDSLYPHLYLGDDSGIRYVWTDTTVKNGVTYYYSVTAYDYGIRNNRLLNPDGYPPMAAKECKKGTDPDAAPNLVAVTPGGPSDNAVYPRVSVSPLPETKGNTEVVVRTVNPFAITGNDYRLVLGKDKAGWYFNIFDETTGVLKLGNVHAVKGGESPVVDGLLPWVFRFDTLGVLTDSTKWVKADGSPSKCNWRVFGWANYKKASYDYEIRFTGKQDTSAFFGKTAPFEIWNRTLNRRAAWEIFINSTKDTTEAMRQRWTDGDYITLREKVDGRLRFTWYFVLESHPSAVPVRVDTVIGGKDTTIVDTTWLDIPPETGDVLEIRTMKPGWVGDSYRIVTRAMKARSVSETDLSGIKVVPNPYIVTAEWETGPEDHRVLFTHLPSECTVKIYTVTGELVRKLDHKDLDSGQEFWDLRNQSNMDVSYGLYLYVVTTPNGKTKGGKFAIVR